MAPPEMTPGSPAVRAVLVVVLGTKGERGEGATDTYMTVAGDTRMEFGTRGPRSVNVYVTPGGA